MPNAMPKQSKICASALPAGKVTGLPSLLSFLSLVRFATHHQPATHYNPLSFLA
jgi:hypothetical protein